MGLLQWESSCEYCQQRRRRDYLVTNSIVASGAAAAPILRRALLGMQTHQTVWQDNPHQTGHVKRYGTILCAYRATREWFVVVDVCQPLWDLGRLSPHSHCSWCTGPGPPALLLCLQCVGLLLVTWFQPYAEPLDHIVGSSHKFSVQSGAYVCVSLTSQEGVADGVAEMESWLGVALLIGLALIGGLFFLCREKTGTTFSCWLKRRLFRQSYHTKKQAPSTGPLLQFLQQICEQQHNQQNEAKTDERSSHRQENTPRRSSTASVPRKPKQQQRKQRSVSPPLRLTCQRTAPPPPPHKEQWSPPPG